MKCLITHFLLLCFPVCVTNVYAGIVSKETAVKVAHNFLKSQGNPENLKSSGNLMFCQPYGNIRLTDGTASENPAFFVFNTENQGFVIISGDDALSPVLAYSKDNPFDFSHMSSGLEALLGDYETAISYAVRKDLKATTTVKEEWANLLQGELKSAFAIDSVQAMTTTKWGYGSPYNNMCPADPKASVKNGGRCPAGCAAVAMAQIMKFWNSPVKGIGSNIYGSNYGDLSANFGLTWYDWKNMPDVVENSSPGYQKNAVATLIYHCGVSVDMDYAYNRSGSYFICEPEPYSYLNCVLKALPKYFGYKKTIRGEMINPSDAKWTEKIRQELIAGRPVLYAGEDTRYNSAHALVIDGFDKNGLFYMNWGLYGFNNGKFRLNLLELPVTETDTYNFVENALIITGIEPDLTISAKIPEMKETINIWPNPATDRLYLELNSNDKSQPEIAILNSTGIKISVLCYNGAPMAIPLNKLNSGVYFIRIQSGKGLITKKFIIR